MAAQKQSRAEATRQALMRTAEKLIASKGLGNITIREIVEVAGQKNESALQYHFKNLTGLVDAIHADRDTQIHEMRSIYLQKLSELSRPITLRDVCELMVGPSFELAQSKPDFRQYVKAFGHELALTDQSASKLARRKGGETDLEIKRLLQALLPDLDEAGYYRRLDSAIRFIASSMYHHARQPKAFQGEGALLFLSSLIDALIGLLGAPESTETKAISRRMGK